MAAAAEYDPSLAVLGFPGSALLAAAERAELEAVPEAFVDRAYLPDGRLVPRTVDGALITDADAAAEQAVRIATGGEVVAIDGTVLATSRAFAVRARRQPGGRRHRRGGATRARRRRCRRAQLHRCDARRPDERVRRYGVTRCWSTPRRRRVAAGDGRAPSSRRGRRASLDVVPAAATVLVTFEPAVPPAAITATMRRLARPARRRSRRRGRRRPGGDRRRLRRRRPRRRGRRHRDAARRGGAAAQRGRPTAASSAGSRRVRLPQPASTRSLVLPRRDTPRPAVPGGLGRDRRPLHGGLPDGLARRVAPARPHRRRAVGRATGRPGDDPARARACASARHAGIAGAPATGTASTAPLAERVDRRRPRGDRRRAGRRRCRTAGAPGSPTSACRRRAPSTGPAVAPLNRLLGNPPAAAVVETAGGLSCGRCGPVVVADSTQWRGDARSRPGDELRVDPRPGELWATLAVRGGVAAAPSLGSRSWDSLARSRAATARRRRPCSPPAPTRAPPIDAVLAPPRADVRAARAARRTAARLVRRRRVVDAASRASWQVTDAVSRVGVRLRGPRLERVAARRGQRARLARASSSAPCRCRPTASRWSCSPTTRPPAATR